MYHTIDRQESYTGATERLSLAQPLVARPVEALLYRWAALAIGTLLLLAWLARLPAPPVVVLEPVPTGGYHYEDRRVCIGIAVCN